MLTPDEKLAIHDHDGPFGKDLLFDTIFQDKSSLARAFVEFCRLHRVSIYVDWMRNPDRTIADLERETSDFGETIDAFLDWLPEVEGMQAVHRIKEVLGTQDVPLVRNPPQDVHREWVRLVQDRIDRLWHARSLPEVSKEEIEALHSALQRFDTPPVDGRQFDALMARLSKLLSLDVISNKDLDPMLHFLRFNFPHHEPLLKDFQRWLEDPNRTQEELIEFTQTQWLERLREMDKPDRDKAAFVIERTITAPEYIDRRVALTSVLRS
jgi:hypothetical protein